MNATLLIDNFMVLYFIQPNTRPTLLAILLPQVIARNIFKDMR